MVETFFDLGDLETAIAAVRSVSSLPIVALMSFDSEGETIGGVSAKTAAARLRTLDVAVFGANHGAGPNAALRALAAMQGHDRPLAALPNVGLASMSGQRVVFPHATPAYFAEFAAQARTLGAQIIGGCCGTTPAQIAAIREAVDENLAPASPLLVRERERATRAALGAEPTTLQRLLDDETFVVSVQLDPPLGRDPESPIATAAAVRDSGKAQFVDLNDNPRARARMSGVMASVAIERFTGVATIPPADDLGLEADRFHRKGAAGARFAMAQVLFSLEPLEAFRERIGGAWPIPVLVGVWPIRTYELLIRMHNEAPGMVVPDDVQERYRRAGPAAREVGGQLGLELIEGAKALAHGVYVVAPFRAPMDVVGVLPELQPAAQSPVAAG